MLQVLLTSIKKVVYCLRWDTQPLKLMLHYLFVVHDVCVCSLLVKTCLIQ